jgi:hypothetical protein
LDSEHVVPSATATMTSDMPMPETKVRFSNSSLLHN